ncbi:stalk domain-containing protein [Schinkia sp. CFF1]
MNQKSYLKGLATGIVGTAIFITSISSVDAFEPFYKNIKAAVATINIIVDGKPSDLQSEPLLIEGKTYLPLRDIGAALGKEVTWDSKNNAIYIGEGQKTFRPSIGLSQLKPIYGETYRNSGFKNDDYLNSGYGGKYYIESEDEGGEISLFKQRFSTLNSIAFLDASSISYNLYDNKYYLIRGLAGVDDTNPDAKGIGIIKLYGDDKELATITTGTKAEKPVPFEVDITGIKKLEIKNIQAKGTASRVALVDVVLEAVQE